MSEVITIIALSVVACYCAANAKALPFAYTVQLLPSLYRLLRPRLFQSTIQGPARNLDLDQALAGSPRSSLPNLPAVPRLFRSHSTKSRAVLPEIDVNMHKSNSTFFTDADISRATLLTSLLGDALAGLGHATPILAAVQARFRREIRPYQAYWVSSRILAWDTRSLYTVTYFLREGIPRLPIEVDVLGGGPAAVLRHERFKDSVLAILVTKYIFNSGRKTVVPAEILLLAGLLVGRVVACVDGDKNKEQRVVGESEGWKAELLEEMMGHGMQYVRDSML